MRKISLLLALLLLCAMPVMAMAAEVTSAETLATELGATASGNTVTLAVPVTLTETVTITSGTIILDLNGQNITAAVGVDPLFKLETGANLTVQGQGSITGEVDVFYVGVKDNTAGATPSAANGATLSIGADVDVVSNTSNCVYIVGASTLNTAGDLTSHSTEYAAIQGNGNSGNWGTTINVTGGTVTSDGTGYKGTAIYQPQSGQLNISGGTVTGPSGIEIRAGGLTMTGGTVTATAAFGDPAPDGSGGTSGGGVAVLVSQHTTNQEIEVDISAGTLNGEKALFITDVETVPAAPAEVDVAVSGGDFNGDVEVAKDSATGDVLASLSSDTQDGFVSGGSFDTAPDDALIEDSAMVATVNGETNVGKDSIEKAAENAGAGAEVVISKANNGDTLTLPEGTKVANVTGENGPSVTVNGELVVVAKPTPTDGELPDFNDVRAPQTEPTPNPNLNRGSSVPDVWYVCGNTFGSSKSATPSAVLIDGLPVSFTGDGRCFTVDCIQPGARNITVKWGTTSVTTNFRADASAVCASMPIPKTGDMPLLARLAAFLGF